MPFASGLLSVNEANFKAIEVRAHLMKYKIEQGTIMLEKNYERRVV